MNNFFEKPNTIFMRPLKNSQKLKHSPVLSNERTSNVSASYELKSNELERFIFIPYICLVLVWLNTYSLVQAYTHLMWLVFMFNAVMVLQQYFMIS